MMLVILKKHIRKELNKSENIIKPTPSPHALPLQSSGIISWDYMNMLDN